MVNPGFGLKNFPVPPGYTLLLSGLFFMAPLSPSLFGWLIGLLAVPVFYLLVVNGYDAGKKQIYFSLLIAGLGSLLVQQWEIFLFSLTLVPLGFTLYKSAYAKESAATSGGKGLIALGLTWLLFWTSYGVIAGTNPYSHLLRVLDLGFQQTLELYSAKEAGLDPETVLSLNQVTALMREMIPKLLPGLLGSLATVTVWMNMVLVNYLMGRLSGVAPWGTYTTWKLPEQMVWMPIAAIFIVLFGKGSLQDAGSWMLALAGLLYLFQGIAVFIALMERWRVPLFVRIILYFIFIIQSYGLILLAILGISDVWLNLRKKTEQQ